MMYAKKIVFTVISTVVLSIYADQQPTPVLLSMPNMQEKKEVSSHKKGTNEACPDATTTTTNTDTNKQIISQEPVAQCGCSKKRAEKQERNDEEQENESEQSQTESDEQEKISAEEEEEEEEQSVRTVTVKNNIDKASLAYKHWTGTHEPKIFIISANDEEIEIGESKDIEIIDDTIYVRYDYDFGYDMSICRGGYEIEFDVDPETTVLDITFSWDKQFRIIIPGATPEVEEKMGFRQ